MTDLGTTLIKGMKEALAFARGEMDDHGLKVHYFFQNGVVVQDDGRSVVYTLKASIEDPMDFSMSLAQEACQDISGIVNFGEVDKKQNLYHMGVKEASQAAELLTFLQAQPGVRDASFPKFLKKETDE